MSDIKKQYLVLCTKTHIMLSLAKVFMVKEKAPISMYTMFPFHNLIEQKQVRKYTNCAIFNAF